MDAGSSRGTIEGQSSMDVYLHMCLCVSMQTTI